MNDFISKIKNWYKNFSSKKVSYEKDGIKPKKDWMIIVLILLFITIILIGISSYFYINVDNGTLFNVPEIEEISETKVNRKLLEKVVGEYDDREIRLNEIKEGRDIPPNPAL